MSAEASDRGLASIILKIMPLEEIIARLTRVLLSECAIVPSKSPEMMRKILFVRFAWHLDLTPDLHIDWA
jgi:hypothetical protein